MKLARSSGILLHPTSLPGRFGVGDLGPEAYRFADFLSAAKQRVWQVLPLGPTGMSNSPYQSFSAFAGNPLLISPDKLVEHFYLNQADLAQIPSFSRESAQFDQVIPYKFALLRKAFALFQTFPEYEEFARTNASWLDPYARFMALRAANGGMAWTSWNAAVRADDAEVRFHKFVQYEFARQWQNLHNYCRDRGIRIMGDIPFYVDHDGADVWCTPGIFDLDEQGNQRSASGVPPDYFSATGQLWGNPTYRWDKLEQTGFRWWIDRLRNTLKLVDIVRLDHFRGFEAYWSVPANETTAIHGHWVKGPGAKLFEAAQRELGPLPVVAENLGMITNEVEALREQFAFPGMKVLQFAFGPDSYFRPHNYPRESVAFTGTHDNDTTVGWWKKTLLPDPMRSLEDGRRERERAQTYLGLCNCTDAGCTSDHEIHWAFIRAVMTSPADVAITPLQDLLGLGSEARLNIPGRADGNWRWRFLPDALTPKLADRLATLTQLCDR
jgi:4-alpha-glucanotransferase